MASASLSNPSVFGRELMKSKASETPLQTIVVHEPDPKSLPPLTLGDGSRVRALDVEKIIHGAAKEERQRYTARPQHPANEYVPPEQPEDMEDFFQRLGAWL